MTASPVRVVATVLLVPILPAAVAHEAAHALAARRVGAGVAVDRWVPPRLRLEWPADADSRAIVLVHLAPSVVGLVAALPVAAVALRVSAPAAAYLVALWVAFVTPSGDDLKPLVALVGRPD
jgi:hypothetical protein